MFFLFDIPIWSGIAKILSGFFVRSQISITAFYTICLVAGLVYTFSLNLLGSGDHDVSGGHDVGGGLSSDHAIHFSPFSPVTLSTFISSFGAVGLIGLKGFGLSPLASAVVSAFISALLAVGIYLLFYRFFILSQASSVVETEEEIGINAEVITPIPKEGIGEIAYSAGVSRMTASARSENGNPIDIGSVVTIKQIVGNIYYVEEAQSPKIEGGKE